jgi:hypothetical protein
LLKGGVIVARVIRENEFGLLECIEENAGEVIWTQLPSKQKLRMLEKGKPLRLKNIPDPRTVGGRPSKFPYSSFYANKIFELICSGLTISKIGKLKDMPDANTIYYWTKKYRDFRLLIENTKEIRREIISDQVLEIALEIKDSKDVPVAKLKVETLKWAYENIKEPSSPSTNKEANVVLVKCHEE